MDSQINHQALNILYFVERNVQARHLIHDLVSRDIETWDSLKTSEKLTILERNVRRFRAECPTLAEKDRVRHAIEAMRWAVRQEANTKREVQAHA
jgi:hypothetical protein